ncbi:hypothetical protein OHS18_20565 [Amycolatopsis sp. NBC_00355]|uniref:hypothetical protein n=1 Tax=Amycolatopsis sp. NBC_00355 TaxID=2975957 RepID=UPI002E26D361
MTSTETVTTAVAQALFQVAADGAVSVVASSLDGPEAEAAWLGLVRPHLSFAETIGASAPLRALSYVVFPDGFAAVLCRTWDPQRPDVVETHALLGEENTVTAELALSTADWPGRSARPPADRRLPSLVVGELRDAAAAAAARLRAQALAHGDLLAHSLAWLLQSSATPIGFLGCAPEDRTAILWALHEIAATELPGRRWTFATHDDGVVNGGFAIKFFESPPEPAGTAGMIVIDLQRDQGASPHNEYRANALVYRYEYGIDPPGADVTPAVLAPPAPVPVAAVPAVMPAPEPVRRSTLTFARWTELAHSLVTARDVRAVDGALVELEYEVAKVDDRDDVRKALENEGWATAAIRRHVPAELRDAVFDRVVQVAFGATGVGRETAAAHDDARRLAAHSRATDVVRAVARAGFDRELADVLAHRWLTEQATADPPAAAGPGRFARILGRVGVPAPARGSRVVLGAVLLLGLVLGVFAGGVLW